MEVHAHTHSPRKKWTHYFWEFLMLFLAVFCGFLAEYQLEHKIEKDREHQYLASLHSDLIDDVAMLDSLIKAEKIRLKELDSLIYLLGDPARTKASADQVYYLARIGPRSVPFSNNTRTFDQLRNSGGFRLIRDNETSNKITYYYGQFSPLRMLENNYILEFDNYKKVAARILDPMVLRSAELEDGSIIRTSNNPLLMTYDPIALKEMAFHGIQMNGSRRGRIEMLEVLRTLAHELPAYIQEEYHLR